MSERLLTILLVILSLALVAAVGVWILRDDDNASSMTGAGAPEALSAAELSDLAAKQSTPVYWLGERDGETYELTEARAGRVYVRYLPEGAEAGDERPSFVTVATYPAEDGVAALKRAAHAEQGAKLAKTDDGAVLLVDPSSPKNAHLAYPGAKLQIEVFSPVPGEALRLAARGVVQPIP